MRFYLDIYKMQEYLMYAYDPNDIPIDKQGEIAEILSNNGEYIKNYTINQIRALAKSYYAIDAIMDMPDHQDKEKSEYLYTIVTYQGEDILLHIATGQFTPEMFTTGNITEYSGLYHSPLKLFVTNKWSRTQDEESSPKEFLAHYAKLYSPKGGSVDIRTGQEKEPINYGNSLGIVQYDDSILALQNAEIHKIFPQDMFKKFCTKIQKLKEDTYENMLKQYKDKDGFHYVSDEDKIFNQTFFTCLFALSGENTKIMYKLIQSFDTQKEVFTKQK